jgi:hypothetical protein
MRNTKLIGIATIIFVVLILIPVAFFYKPNQLDEIYISGAIENKEWTNDFKSAAVYLRKFGIKATLIETTGPIEVATLLNDPNSKLNTGFVFDGLLTQAQAANLSSLGSVSYDPIWIFYNEKTVGTLTSLADIAKHRVVVGQKDSDSYALSKKLFDLNDINIQEKPNFLPLSRGEDLRTFLSGEADVIIYNGPFTSEVIEKSFKAGFKLFEIPNANNYTTKSNFIVLTLPAGSMDINGKVPRKDINLLATTTLLVVKNDLEPALQLSLLMTASKMIRENPYKYNNITIRFPAPVFDSSIQTSPTAKKFYADGPPTLIKLFPWFLPYWPFLVGYER